MSKEKKPRASRRLTLEDEMEMHIRDASAEVLRDLAVRVAKESRMREMQARRSPRFDSRLAEEPLGGDGTPRGE